MKSTGQNANRPKNSQSSRKRILLADDNPAILDLVVEILRRDYEVIGAVSDGNSVLLSAESLRPDVLVLDISMGAVSGIELARLLLEQGFTGKIVFLTVHEDPDFLRAAIGAGGSAYVVKTRLDIDLLPAIRETLRGRFFVSSSLRHHEAS